MIPSETQSSINLNKINCPTAPCHLLTKWWQWPGAANYKTSGQAPTGQVETSTSPNRYRRVPIGPSRGPDHWLTRASFPIVAGWPEYLNSLSVFAVWKRVPRNSTAQFRQTSQPVSAKVVSNWHGPPAPRPTRLKCHERDHPPARTSFPSQRA